MNRSILAVLDDMFFKSKLLETAKHLNVSLSIVSNPDILQQKLEETNPDLIIVDLATRKDPLPAIQQLKDSEKNKNITIVGYFEHRRTDLHQKGKEAGIDHLYARSYFTENLAQILSQK